MCSPIIGPDPRLAEALQTATQAEREAFIRAMRVQLFVHGAALLGLMVFAVIVVVQCVRLLLA